MNTIFFKFIKNLINLLKKLNLDKFIMDKLIFCIGLNQVLENKKIYNEVKDIQEIELKIFWRSNIFSFFLVSSITLDLPSIKYLMYTLDLSGKKEPVSTISEK